MNQSQTLSLVRKECKDNGVVFRKVDGMTLNHKPAYQYIDKYSGRHVAYTTIEGAYQDVLSGYISTYSPHVRKFLGNN